MKYIVFLLLIFSSFNIQGQSFTLPKSPKTFAKEYNSSVLVNVLVDTRGHAKKVELADPDDSNPHKTLALLKAKHKTYALRTHNGEPIEYWMKNVKIMFNVSAMHAGTGAPASNPEQTK